MTKIEALTEARRLLLEVGWCKKSYRKFDYEVGGSGDDIVGYCAVGAVRAATNLAAPYDGCISSLLNLVLPVEQEDYFSIVAFNDVAESVDQVIALFDKAIVACQFKETQCI